MRGKLPAQCWNYSKECISRWIKGDLAAGLGLAALHQVHVGPKRGVLDLLGDPLPFVAAACEFHMARR